MPLKEPKKEKKKLGFWDENDKMIKNPNVIDSAESDTLDWMVYVSATPSTRSGL